MNLKELEEQHKKLGEEIERLKHRDFRQVESWEDLEVISGFYVCGGGAINNIMAPVNITEAKLVATTKELCEAWIAVCQLSQLRDRVRDGWVPDWEDGGGRKYIIFYESDALISATSKVVRDFLAFETLKQRDNFLESHRELIEQARPILGG